MKKGGTIDSCVLLAESKAIFCTHDTLVTYERLNFTLQNLALQHIVAVDRKCFISSVEINIACIKNNICTTSTLSCDKYS